MKSQGTFCEHSLTFLIGSSALALVAHEHQREAHQQQPAADPDGADVSELRHETAEACACGENLTAADVGIGVLKAAGERDEDRCAEGIRHLPVKMMTVLHTAPRLS